MVERDRESRGGIRSFRLSDRNYFRLRQDFPAYRFLYARTEVLSSSSQSRLYRRNLPVLSTGLPFCFIFLTCSVNVCVSSSVDSGAWEADVFQLLGSDALGCRRALLDQRSTRTGTSRQNTEAHRIWGCMEDKCTQRFCPSNTPPKRAGQKEGGDSRPSWLWPRKRGGVPALNGHRSTEESANQEEVARGWHHSKLISGRLDLSTMATVSFFSCN